MNICSGIENFLLSRLRVESKDLIREKEIEEDKWSNSSEETALNLGEVINLESTEWSISDLESGLDIEKSVGEDPGSSGDWGKGGTFVPVFQVPEEEGVIT